MRATRHKELGYDCYGPKHWQHIDAATLAQVGPIYATERELLAAHDAYAALFGCEGTEDPYAALLADYRAARGYLVGLLSDALLDDDAREDYQRALDSLPER